MLVVALLTVPMFAAAAAMRQGVCPAYTLPHVVVSHRSAAAMSQGIHNTLY